MTQITIDDGTGKPEILTDAVVAKLAPVVDRTNDANGTRYTTAQWIALHTKEMALADDLHAAAVALEEQHRKDAEQALAAAIRAARDELIASLAEPAAAGSQPE